MEAAVMVIATMVMAVTAWVEETTAEVTATMTAMVLTGGAMVIEKLQDGPVLFSGLLPLPIRRLLHRR
uniref:Putative secreted protein n=1 Tax=Anopheles triannulatus TaxID=58253 RepID=A0A2M4B7M2_9DIPT